MGAPTAFQVPLSTGLELRRYSYKCLRTRNSERKVAGSSHVTGGRNGRMSLSHVVTDSQKTRQGGLNHFTTVGGQGWAGSDKLQ